MYEMERKVLALTKDRLINVGWRPDGIWNFFRDYKEAPLCLIHSKTAVCTRLNLLSDPFATKCNAVDGNVSLMLTQAARRRGYDRTTQFNDAQKEVGPVIELIDEVMLIFANATVPIPGLLPSPDHTLDHTPDHEAVPA